MFWSLVKQQVKGTGEREWEGERVIVSGVSERMRAREGVAVVVRGRLWGGVTEYECVNLRIVWIRMKVAGEKVVVV